MSIHQHSSPVLRKHSEQPGQKPHHHSKTRQLSPLSTYTSPSRQQRQHPLQSQLQKPQQQQQERKKRIESLKSGIVPACTALHETPLSLVPSSMLPCASQSQNEEYNAASQHHSLNMTYSTAAAFSQFASLHATHVASGGLSENLDPAAAELEEAAASTSVFGFCITDEVLRGYTGWEDLHLVLSAEFRIDATSMTGVDTIGERLPMLESLKLNNSRVPQVRLLGTKFTNLKWLWLGNSRLENLRGIGACAPVLKELYVPFNFIDEISPLLDLCETLEVVDLEGNAIADTSMLKRVLPLLSHVKYLTLQGNPVMIAPSTAAVVCDSLQGGKEKDSNISLPLNPVARFRAFLKFLMPNLEYVDDTPVLSLSTEEKTASDSTLLAHRSSGKRKTNAEERGSIHVDPLDSTLSDEYMFLQQCIRDCGFDALDFAISDDTQAVFTRPSTSCAGARRRRETPSSLGGSQRPHSSHLCNSLNGSTRLSQAGLDGRWSSISRVTPPVPSTASGLSYSSPLTTGGPFVGHSITLRRRLPPLSPPPPPPPPPPPAVAAVLPAPQEISDPVPTPEKRKEIPCQDTVMDANASLFDDDEDDEWETLKQSLNRRTEKISKTMELWAKYASISENESSPSEEPESGRGLSLSPSIARPLSTSSNRTPSPVLGMKRQSMGGGKGDCASPISKEEEEEFWRRELMRCVAQSRSKTAKVAHTPDFLAAGNTDMVDISSTNVAKVSSED